MASRRVLEGIVPVLMHTPPTMSVRSTTAARRPSLAAAIAAFWPPGPEPITSRSYSYIRAPFGRTRILPRRPPAYPGGRRGLYRPCIAVRMMRVAGRPPGGACRGGARDDRAESEEGAGHCRAVPAARRGGPRLRHLPAGPRRSGGELELRCRADQGLHGRRDPGRVVHPLLPARRHRRRGADRGAAPGGRSGK